MALLLIVHESMELTVDERIENGESMVMPNDYAFFDGFSDS